MPRNRLEQWVYDLVKDRPVLKQRIVDLYQLALGLVPQKPIRTDLHPVVRAGYFFGYHDKSPFSSNGELLLAHRDLIGSRTVRRGDEAEVGYFSGPDWTEWTPFGCTAAWNWQLGSMLQWVGGDGQHAAYNVLDEGRAASLLTSLDGRVVARWPHPIVHFSPDGSRACSYDFHRVEQAMVGYGIVGHSVQRDDRAGRFLVFDCVSGEVTFEISLGDVATISHHPSMDGAFHYFHHALFSPDGRRLFFLHRWLDLNERRWTRMFSVSPDGADLYLFPMDEMVSHVTWASPTTIFGYLRYPEQGDGYYLIEDGTGRATRYFADILDSDGHPTMDRARGFVLTDTYPDRFRNQYLVLCMMASGARIDLCRTHLPRQFVRELQVDLHPRIHPARSVACFDSGHVGTRSLVTVDFSDAL